LHSVYDLEVSDGASVALKAFPCRRFVFSFNESSVAASVAEVIRERIYPNVDQKMMLYQTYQPDVCKHECYYYFFFEDFFLCVLVLICVCPFLSDLQFPQSDYWQRQFLEEDFKRMRWNMSDWSRVSLPGMLFVLLLVFTYL
jgi:hypothetical protein